MADNLLKVLIVSGGGFQGLTLIKGLRQSDDVRIYIADSSKENIGKYFADSFVLVPDVTREDEFINALLSFCVKENIDVIMPSTDVELHAMSSNKTMFMERGIYVAVFDIELLEVIRNKRRLHVFLAEYGFPLPPMIDIRDDNVHFPLIGKPLSGWGGKNTLILETVEDLKRYQREDLHRGYIWQPYYRNFREFSVDFAIGFDGSISGVIQRRRTRTSGGFSVIAESDDDPQVARVIHDLIGILRDKGAQGMVNVQLLNIDNGFVISDVNPRVGTSAVFSYGLGENLPLFLCSYIRPDIYRSTYDQSEAGELKMVRYLEEFWIKKIKGDDIGGIVFDLDDTLINQKAWIIDKLSLLWTQHRWHLPDREGFLLKALYIIEKGNRGYLFDELGELLQWSEDFKTDLIEGYRHIIPEECPLFSDVTQSLVALNEMNIPLALLTDNPPASQKQKVNACRLDDFFRAIIYAGEFDTEKPDPMMYEKAARSLYADKQSLIMVGDNLYKDIMGSLDAGFLYAYWILRDGTFYNFDDGLLRRISAKRYHYSRISHLRQLVLALSARKV